MAKKIGECVHCHETKEILGRGLCVKHYNQARNGKIPMPEKIKKHVKAEVQGECNQCHEPKPIVARGLCRKCYDQGKAQERRGKRKGKPGPKPARTAVAPRPEKKKRKYTRRAATVQTQGNKGIGEAIGHIFDKYNRKVIELCKKVMARQQKEIEQLQDQVKSMRLSLLKERHAIQQEVKRQAEKKYGELERIIKSDQQKIEPEKVKK